MSSITYVRIEDPYYPLNFKVTGTGPTRISELPPSVEKVANGHHLLNILMSQYQKGIEKCAKKWNLVDVPQDPMVCCAKFSEWVVKNQHHNNTHLDLSNLELEILPPQIGLFRELTHLNLSGNHLRRLFPELTSLQNLQELDISGNTVELPDLSSLPHLRVVKANDCNLVEVPQWISKCPKLQSIEMKDNLIDEELYPDLDVRVHLS